MIATVVSAQDRARAILALRRRRKADPSVESKRNAARTRLIEACRYLDPNYRVNFHHEIIAEAFERFAAGRCPQVMILEAPPGTGKSDIVSRKGPAWAIGRDPTLFFANASYSSDLAESHSTDCYNICVSSEYRQLFPHSDIGRTLGDDGKRRSQAKEWRTADEGGYKALGRRGGITGRHPNRFILDDLFKDDVEAQSEAVRNEVWEFFLKVVLQRMGAHGKILIMMTRWHRDDLIGRLVKLKKENPLAVNYEVVTISARLDDAETRHPDDPRGLGEPLWPWMYAGGKPGTPIYEPGAAPEGHPDNMTPEEQDMAARAYLATWEATDPAGFMSQGQQQPAPKSAYGAHAYNEYGTHNWVESYRPVKTRPVLVGMDFNYDPMGSILAQETTLGELFPTKYPGNMTRAFCVFQANAFKNCGTEAACERILDQVGKGFTFKIYPDASAKSRTPHGEGGTTDLKIIEAVFQRNGKFWVRIKPANPKRKDRLNAVNAALSCKGKRLPARPEDGPDAAPRFEYKPPLAFFVKGACEPLLRDFLECGMEEFLNAQFSDSALGHTSDAFGYFVDYELPIAGGYTMFIKR